MSGKILWLRHSSEGKSASAVLVDFICWYRTGNRIALYTKSSTNLSNLDSLIDERIEAKLNKLKTLDSQPHSDNLDTILDVRDRRVESRLLSILETMLEAKLDDKLEELQGNIRHIELSLDKRIETLSQTPIAAPTQLGDGDTGNIEKEEVESMQHSTRAIASSNIRIAS